ncbi:MAG TPA: 1-phosphofructokinase [Clostridia bacterium]|nr:1-phosphofructokinase [Clostridia bacterium]
MIITVTLNPAIDQTVYIDNFQINEVNRIKSIRKDIGGKGINVSQNLNNLKKDNLCVSILAGLNGRFIKDALVYQGFNFKMFEVDGEVRINLKAVDLKNNTFTDINEPGFELSEEESQNIIRSIVELAKPDDILVLSGSVPKGFQSNVYQEIIENVECKTILDTSGELFVKGLEAKPYLIKPNIHELEELLNVEKISSEKEIVTSAKKLIENGVEIVVVSLGAQGSIYVTQDKTHKIEGKKVDVKSTVGAGDSMVAALAIALDENYTIENMAKFASAVSTASIMSEGSQPGDIKIIEELMNNGG